MSLLNTVFSRQDATWRSTRPDESSPTGEHYADAEDVRNRIRLDLSRFGDVEEIHGQILFVRGRWKLSEVTTTVHGKTVYCEMRDNELHYRSKLGPIILPPASYSFHGEHTHRTVAQIHEDTFTDLFGTPEARRRLRTYRIARAINSMRADDPFDPLIILTVLLILGFSLSMLVPLMLMSGLSTTTTAVISAAPVALFLGIIAIFCITAHVAERTKQAIASYDLSNQPQENLHRTLTELCDDHHLEFLGGARPTLNNIVNLQHGDPITLADHHLTFQARSMRGTKGWFITDGLSIAPV